MDEPRAAEVVRLLHNILGEVRTVKATVQTHEARFDDMLLQLKLLHSRDEAPFKPVPCLSGLEMAGCSSDEEGVDRGSKSSMGPTTGILWNENPLAASTNSLDLGTSNGAVPEAPIFEEVPVLLQAPASCERMVTISSAVNHSLASIPLHTLADRPQSTVNRHSAGLNQGNIRSRSAPASPARHSDLQDTPKSSFGKRMTGQTDFNCNDNSSTGSDIDRSAPADPLTTHSASSLSTSYSLDPLRPSPPLFHPISSSADAAINPATEHGQFRGGVQPIALQKNLLSQPGRFDSRGDKQLPSRHSLEDDSSLQVSPSTLQGALDDNDKNLVNLTTTGITQCGSNPIRSMTNKSGHWPMNASACDPTMCSMNGGLTFRHMLLTPSVVPSLSARDSSQSTNVGPGDSVVAVRACRATHATDGKGHQACRVVRSVSPGEPMLTFRAMLPATPEEQSLKCPHDCDHDMRSSSAPTEFSPAPSSHVSDLTDPNESSPIGQVNHLESCCKEGGNIGDSSSGSGQEHVHGVESPWRREDHSSSLMRPMLLSCHGQLDWNRRYQDGCTSRFDTRSPFSRSTSAASTPKRKFGEMRQADSPAAWQSTVSDSDAGDSDDHTRVPHAPHVPRLQLPRPTPQGTPTHRYLSPPLHISCAITDFALQDSYDGEGSPRAMSRYGSQFNCHSENSVYSHDMLPFGNMPEQTSASGLPVSEAVNCEQGDEENIPPAQHQKCSTLDCDTDACIAMVPDSTPTRVQDSSDSSYESPPSLVPPFPAKGVYQHNALGSAAGSECTVEMGCCSPTHNCNPPPSCMLPEGSDAAENNQSSPCMRKCIAFAPDHAAQALPQFQGIVCQAREPQEDAKLREISGSVQSGGSAGSIDGESDFRAGNSCMESHLSHQHHDSPQTSGSTVYSSFYSRSVENACPNSFPCIPDTPSSKAASDTNQGQECGIDADCSISQLPLLGTHGYQRGRCFDMQNCRHSEVVWQAGDSQYMSRSCSDAQQSCCCSMPPCDDDTRSSCMMSQQAAESLTSDEINAWKAQHCMPSLTHGNEDDSLVILTNKLLRAAFRAQRRAEMQQSLTTGGSYAAPRRFLCMPLDPSVLDALAMPVAVRASEMSDSVENIVDATLPRTLRLSHCFAAWRYILGGGLGSHSATCSQSVETLPEAKTTDSTTQPSGSDTFASDVCTEAAVSCIRRTVVNSCLFSLETSMEADVRASTASNARSPGVWLDI